MISFEIIQGIRKGDQEHLIEELRQQVEEMKSVFDQMLGRCSTDVMQDIATCTDKINVIKDAKKYVITYGNRREAASSNKEETQRLNEVFDFFSRRYAFQFDTIQITIKNEKIRFYRWGSINRKLKEHMKKACKDVSFKDTSNDW